MARHAMLIEAESSALLIIDVQERLLPAVDRPADVVRNLGILLTAARRLNVPILATEQYPSGLGATIDQVGRSLPSGSVVEKIHFSAYREAAFKRRIDDLERRQFVLAGLEAHVCVLQSALDLLAAGYSVFVAADAVASRTPSNKSVAEARMRAEGIRLVSTEMVVFEWLQRAATRAFRDLLPSFR